MAAICLSFSSFTILAAALERNDNGKNVVNGNATDVYAGTVVPGNNAVAINKFKNFNVTANDTVNLHYNELGKTQEAAALVNFVDSRINIDGVVNTINHNEVGQGKLYFFSQNGMVLSKNGYINADTLVVATPSEESWNQMISNDAAMADVINSGDMSQYSLNNSHTITVDAEGGQHEYWPGTITIASKDNLHVNDASLYAPHAEVLERDIVRSDYGANTYTYYADHQYIELYAGKVYPNQGIAVNTFRQFNLVANDIVDMYYSQEGESDAGIYNLVTLTFNKIGGATTAQIVDSTINQGLDVESRSPSSNKIVWVIRTGTALEAPKEKSNTLADVTVKATDYTNNKSISGGAAVGGNVAVGLVGEWNTVDRQITSKVSGQDGSSKKDALSKADTTYAIRAHDFNVNAISKQALSSLDAAAAVQYSTKGVAATGSGSWNDLSSYTDASVSDINVLYGRSANIEANHEDRVYTGSAGASVSLGNAGVGFASSFSTQESGTHASVQNSVLKGLGNASAAAVRASGASKAESYLMAVGLSFNFDPYSPSFGISGAINKNTLQSLVTADVTDSAIEAGHIDILSSQHDETSALIGGLSGGTWAGIGASVSLADFNDYVATAVAGSTLRASNGNATIGSEDTRQSSQHVGNAALGAVGLSLNYIETGVNQQGISTASTGSDDTRKNINDQIANINKLFSSSNPDQTGTNGSTTSLYGVHTKVSSSAVTADKGNAVITANENNGFNLNGGALAAGIGAASGSIAKLKENHHTDVAVQDATIAGKDVIVKANRGDVTQDDVTGTKIHTWQGGFGGIAGGVSWASVTSSGNVGVSLQDASITAAQDTTVNASDTSTAKAIASGLNVGLGVAAGYNQALIDNTSTVGVSIGNTNAAKGHAITSGNTLTIQALRDLTNTAEGWGFSIALTGGGVGSLADVADTGEALLQIQGSGYTVGGKSAALQAVNESQVTANSDGEAAGIIAGVGRTKGTAKLTGTAKVTAASGNTFKADTLDVNARMGRAGERTASSDVFGGAASIGASVGANSANANTDTQAVVDIGNETYEGNSGIEGQTNVTLTSENLASRRANIWGHSTALLYANGSNGAYTEGSDRSVVSAAGGQVNNLDMTANNQSQAYAKATNVSAGLVTTSPYASEAKNTLNTSSQVVLLGTWNIADTLNANAKEQDVSQIHARSSMGGGGAVGSAEAITEMKNYQDMGTQVRLGGNADIKAGTVNAKAVNNLAVQNADGEGNTVNVNSGGAVSVNKDPEARQTVDKSADVTVVEESVVHASGNQVYEASTTQNISGNTYSSAAGAIAIAGGVAKNDVTLADTVNIKGTVTGNGNNSGVITLSAWDASSISAEVTTDAAGAAGGAYAQASNTVNRKNQVNLTGMARDASALNLYVGKKADGTTPELTMYAYGYNHDNAPGKTRTPDVTNTIFENNQVLVGDSSYNNVGTPSVVLDYKGNRNITTVQKMLRWGLFHHL